MSDTPKYTPVELERQRQERLEEERRQKAKEEARRRAQAEAAERKRRTEAARIRVHAKSKEAIDEVRKHLHELYDSDGRDLQGKWQKLSKSIDEALDEKRLNECEDLIQSLLAAFSQAAAKKRRDELEAKRLAELEQLRFRMEEVERRLEEIPAADASKFDKEGGKLVADAAKRAGSAISAGKPEDARGPVAHLEEKLEEHHRNICGRRAEWEQQRRKAEEDIGLLTEHIEGLHADPVLARWHARAVATLAARVTEAKEDARKELFARPAEILVEVRQVSERLIAEANAAQLKADQRDYIASSIVETLKAMKFVVAPIAPEHANHPATAVLIHAVTSANQSVDVSVPVEGQLMYTVDGYPMTTEAVMGGGRAAACDQAEQVLNDMQSRLQEAFGVRTGEIWWESKNPDRLTGKAPTPTAKPENRKA